MKCDMLHTCLWYQSALVRGLWKFLEDVWVVRSTSGQILTGIKAGGIPGVAAQMAAHRGFSAISRLYQYQLRPSKVVSFTPDVTKPAKQPTKPLLGYESAGTWWAVGRRYGICSVGFMFCWSLGLGCGARRGSR